jgi:hypothetical protein
VTITASDPNAAENALDTGAFAVSRTGGTFGDLTVNFGVGGSAIPGTDYAAIGASVTIPDGQVAATITVTPNDDAFVEGSETVSLTLMPGAGYSVGAPASDTVTIADDDEFVVSITANDSNAAEMPLDTGMFTVSRTGGTSGGLCLPEKLHPAK